MQLSNDQLADPIVPRTVALELLWGCNLKCNYCYIGAEKNWQHPIVPRLNALLPVIDKIAAAGVSEIYLVGGEPTSHPKFEEICEHIARVAIPVRGLCTNGTMITPRLAKLLKTLDFYVDVSFRGAGAELFDQITGVTGSFQKAVQGVCTLAEEGLSVGIEFDCTAQTAPTLYPLVYSLLDLGVRIHQVFLHRISPVGDAAHLPDQGQMTLGGYEQVFAQARRIQAEFALPITFEDGFPLCLTDPANWEYIVPCECGTFFATVDPRGNVRRCPCHSAILGNLLETELSVIWSEALQEFRSLCWTSEACKSCALLQQCRGGCAVSSPDCAEGFAPDIFSDQFVPFKEIPTLSRSVKGLLGQDIIQVT